MTSPPKKAPSLADLDRAIHEHVERYAVEGAEREVDRVSVLRALLAFVADARPGDEKRVRIGPNELWLRLDERGQALASLAARVIEPRFFPSVEEARAALRDDFKLAASDGDRAFAPDELGSVYTAFTLLDLREIRSLAGMELHRVSRLPAGRESLEIQTDLEGGRLAARLYLTDLVFAGESAIGLTLHETANAIQKLQRFRVGVKVLRSQRALKDRWAERDLFEGLVWRDAPSLALARWKGAVRAVQASLQKIGEASAEPEIRKAQALLEGALNERRSAAERLSPKERAFIAEVEARQDAHVDDAERYVELSATYWHETVVLAERGKKIVRSRRLHRFIEFVEQNEIQPLVSAPKPGSKQRYSERFAEAFVLFKTNPEKLHRAQPELYWWFAAREHLG